MMQSLCVHIQYKLYNVLTAFTTVAKKQTCFGGVATCCSGVVTCCSGVVTGHCGVVTPCCVVETLRILTPMYTTARSEILAPTTYTGQ